MFALIGLLASLQGIMFAYGRNMYSLSRAGYYPKCALADGQAPDAVGRADRRRASSASSSCVVVACDRRLNGATARGAGAIVLNIAVWGAVLSYMLQMVSFVILRRKFPNAIASVQEPDRRRRRGRRGHHRRGDVHRLPAEPDVPAGDHRDRWSSTWSGSSLFALIGRHRLVLSPEEEYAISGGPHGDPQKEGYDAMEGEVFGKDGKK